jgi:hypothetical protein
MYEVIALHRPFADKNEAQTKSMFSNHEYPQLEDKEGLYDVEMIRIINAMLTVCF